VKDVTVGAGGVDVVTVTAIAFVLFPPSPVAVSVNVVVDEMVTFVVPDDGNVPATPDMDTDLASVVFHDSVTSPDPVKEEGVDEKDDIVGGGVVVVVVPV